METKADNLQGQPPQKSSSGILKAISEHPIFTIVCGVATLFGTGFGVWGYLATIEKPELTYYVSPTRIPIIQTNILGSEEVNNFSVKYRGNHVGGNVSAAEIQIWNEGKKPIRGKMVSDGGDIEKAVTLRMLSGQSIYTASFTTNRDAIGFTWLDSTNKQFGVLQMDWQILEKGDGVKVQIFYAGNVTDPISVDGAIIGQKEIYKYNGASHKSVSTVIIILNIVTFALCVTMLKFSIKGNELKAGTLLGKFSITLYVIMIVGSSIQAAVSAIGFYSAQVRPPFGL